MVQRQSGTLQVPDSQQGACSGEHDVNDRLDDVDDLYNLLCMHGLQSIESGARVTVTVLIA